MPYLAKMTVEQREVRRIDAVKLMRRGAKAEWVAQKFGITTHTLYAWTKKARLNGIRSLKRKPRSGRPKKLTDAEAAEAKTKRDRDATRKLAIEAFKAGKDTWETKIESKDGKVTGTTRFDEGILRFIGSAIAKFSNEVLK